MAVWDAISANTPNRLIFDAGALYRDKDETSEELIGATRGGSVFTIEREDRQVELDGIKGPVKGLNRTINHAARLSTTILELSEQTWLDLTRGTAVSDGTHLTITPDNAILLADYYTNVALVAEVANQTDPCIIKLLNAIVDSEITLTVNDDDEGQLEFEFLAHYDSATASVPPYTIEWPVGAS